MKKSLKKLIAIVSSVVMALSMGITAFAVSVSDSEGTVTGECSFYRYKDSVWSAAPYGMDDGNIKTAVLNSDGTITLYFDFAEYEVMGFLPVTGGIANVEGAGVIKVGTDADGDKCLDWAIIKPDTEFELTICDTSGNTNIAFGIMPNPITAKLVYTAQ